MSTTALPLPSVVKQRYEESVDVATLHRWPGNPRRSHRATIRDSIRANGFYGALVVQDSSRRICAGHGRLDSALDEGLTHLPVLFIDVDDDTAKAILAVDNRANDLAVYDRGQLREFMAGLARPTIGTGYTQAAIQALLAEAAGTGSLLQVADVSIAEPTHEVKVGDLWQIERHTLVCEDVMTGWPVWAPLLDEKDALFVPYPGPYAALSERAERRRLVLVQPDPYIAGHVLDKYSAMRGEAALVRLRP